MLERLTAIPRTDVVARQQQQTITPTSPELENGGGTLEGPRGDSPSRTISKHLSLVKMQLRICCRTLRNHEYQARMQLELFWERFYSKKVDQ